MRKPFAGFRAEIAEIVIPVAAPRAVAFNNRVKGW